jgi:RsiW-degrading membrane proteinase PrsW (M82 family)
MQAPEPLLMQDRAVDPAPVAFVNNEQLRSLRGGKWWLIAQIVFVSLLSVFAWGFDLLMVGLEGAMIIMVCLLVSGFAVFGIHHILQRRHAGQGFVSLQLVAHMFLRGATISIVIAIFLELLDFYTAPPRPVEWGKVPLALAIGISEEFGKAIVVVLGLHVSPYILPQSLIVPASQTFLGMFSTQSCTRFWTYVIESPRALAMVGISTGFGFATTENVEYFIEISTISSGSSSFLIMLIRLVLDLHPLLTGLFAARLASLVYFERDGVIIGRSISLGKFLRAITPSILIHATYDFGLMFTNQESQLGSDFLILSIVMIPLVWVLIILTYSRLPVQKSREVVVVSGSVV